MVEDEAERLLRVLREDRQALVEQIAAGKVQIDNVEGGYRDLTGQIKGIDRAIDKVLEVFRDWLPQAPPPPTPARGKVDFY